MPLLSSSSSPPPLCRRIILGADGHLPARLPLSSCGFFGNTELRIGNPPPLSPLRAHPTRLRDGRGGRCHAWMRRWMDDEWMDGSRVSPWEVSMCACLCVCARVAITVPTSEPVSVGIRVYDEGFSVNIRARARCPCTCACWWWGRSFEDELYY